MFKMEKSFFLTSPQNSPKFNPIVDVCCVQVVAGARVVGERGETN